MQNKLTTSTHKLAQLAFTSHFLWNGTGLGKGQMLHYGGINQTTDNDKHECDIIRLLPSQTPRLLMGQGHM